MHNSVHFSFFKFNLILLYSDVSHRVSRYGQKDEQGPRNNKMPHICLRPLSLLLMPEIMLRLNLEPDLTPIPDILEAQHHAAHVEPDQS